MPYAAANNMLSKGPLDGGVEITDEQYIKGQQLQRRGGRIDVRNGRVLFLSAKTRIVYSTADKSPLEIPENDDTPSGYTGDKPGQFDDWGGAQWVEDAEAALEAAKEGKLADVEASLQLALESGMPYTMPDGTSEVVQTRAEDEPNLLGLAIEARDLRADGVTDAVQALRVQSNVIYMLTPQQMIDVTDAAKSFKLSQLQRSWQLKAQIKNATTVADMDAIAWPSS